MIEIKTLPEMGISYIVENISSRSISIGVSATQASTLTAQAASIKAAESIHQTQILFNWVNAAWICWEIKNFTKLSIPVIGSGFLGIASLACTSVALQYLLNKYYIPKVKPDNILTYDRPQNQSIAQLIYAIRIVANIALAYFSTTQKIYYITTSLGMGYSLLKTSQLKWLKLSKTFNHVTFTYHALLFPYRGAEKCVKCFKEHADIYFCTDHPLHTSCFLSLLEQKGKKFDQGIVIKSTNDKTSFRFHETYIPQKKLPSCPSCKDVPRHNFVSAEETPDKGRFNLVTIVDSPPKFTLWSSKIVEITYVVYNSFQSSLIWLIKARPDLIAEIIAMQHIMVFSDLAALIRDSMALKETIDEREISFETKLKIVGHALLYAVATRLFIGWLNWTFQPAIDLKKILVSHLSLGTKDANSVTLTWARTNVEMMNQWIYLLRIGVTGTSYYYSPTIFKSIHLAQQTFNLIQLSKLPWIRVDQKIDKFVALTVDTTFYFLPDPNILSSEQKLKTALTSIYEYTSSFFKGSKWELWKRIGNMKEENFYKVFCPNLPAKAPFLGTVFGYIGYHALDLTLGN